MAKRLPASMHTREGLQALIEGRLASAAGREELVKLATRLIMEEALEAEARGRLDQGVDGSGALTAGVGAGEEVILAAEGNRPFILPMSGRSWKSITDGTHILAARSPCVAWSSGRRAASSRCRDRQAS